MTHWHERFFEGLYARVLATQFGAEASLTQARLIRRLLRLRRGQRVLDVPCGQGRITLPLAQAGLRVTGLDRTAKYLARAKRQAGRLRLGCRFLQGDMRRLAFAGEFDAVVNWFGSFGYFTDAQNLAFCRGVFRSLKPGGRFLVEGINKSWLKAHFHPRSEQRLGGVSIRQHSRFNSRQTHLRTTWRLERGRSTEHHTIRIRLFSGSELRRFLRSAGFVEVRLFGPGGSRFTRHSRRLLAVAVKPGGNKRGKR